MTQQKSFAKEQKVENTVYEASEGKRAFSVMRDMNSFDDEVFFIDFF